MPEQDFSREVARTLAVNTLTELSRACPHLRVGQIIDNAVTTYLQSHPASQPDLFTITDELLARALVAYWKAVLP